MKAVALVGSLRKESYNRMLARFLQDRYREHWTLEIADIAALPFYNQDQEEAPPPVVSQFKQQIRNADAVVIVTPEFNWSIPGVLKNALDWLSRVDRVLNQKPVLIAGASQSLLGTVRAQLHLREILSSPGLAARMLPPGGNEILITFAAQKFDAAGRLTDEATVTFIDGVVQKFLQLVNG